MGNGEANTHVRQAVTSLSRKHWLKIIMGLESNGEEIGVSHLKCTTGSACVIVEITRVNKDLRSTNVLSGVVYVKEGGRG